MTAQQVPAVKVPGPPMAGRRGRGVEQRGGAWTKRATTQQHHGRLHRGARAGHVGEEPEQRRHGGRLGHEAQRGLGGERQRALAADQERGDVGGAHKEILRRRASLGPPWASRSTDIASSLPTS